MFTLIFHLLVFYSKKHKYKEVRESMGPFTVHCPPEITDDVKKLSSESFSVFCILCPFHILTKPPKMKRSIEEHASDKSFMKKQVRCQK